MILRYEIEIFHNGHLTRWDKKAVEINNNFDIIYLILKLKTTLEQKGFKKVVGNINPLINSPYCFDDKIWLQASYKNTMLVFSSIGHIR